MTKTKSKKENDSKYNSNMQEHYYQKVVRLLPVGNTTNANGMVGTIRAQKAVIEREAQV